MHFSPLVTDIPFNEICASAFPIKILSARSGLLQKSSRVSEKIQIFNNILKRRLYTFLHYVNFACIPLRTFSSPRYLVVPPRQAGRFTGSRSSSRHARARRALFTLLPLILLAAPSRRGKRFINLPLVRFSSDGGDKVVCV